MDAIDGTSASWYGAGMLATVGVLLFAGACGKSAQIPLFVWLPDAMAGPTPVSALIHAATMVTAGVYMLSRCSAILWHAPAAMAVVAVVGCATALVAATMGICQTDIKKVLAYSTVSQLGYMFLGIGVGAFFASIFHLMTHAFFKACLFLGSGSVIHAMGGEQDIRRMGGLKKWMPVTWLTFFISTLAIAGIPPLAGFFSKDQILGWALTSTRGSVALFVVGVLTAGMTAFYMFRLTWLTFAGSFRGTHEQEHHLHESPRSMTLPLQVLAGLAVVGGLVGVPKMLSFGADINVIQQWLQPVVGYHGVEPPKGPTPSFWAPGEGTPALLAGVTTGRDAAGLSLENTPEQAPHAGTSGSAAAEGEAGHGAGHGAAAAAGEGHGGAHGGSSVEGQKHESLAVEWVLLLMTIGIAVAGILLARAFYLQPGSTLPARFASALGPVYRLVLRKYFVDELYDLAIVRPWYLLCRVFAWLDKWIVDGAVNGTRHLTVGLSHVSNGFDRWVVDLAVNGVAWGFRGGSWVLRRMQTGLVQNYAAAMVFGTFFLLSLYLILWK